MILHSAKEFMACFDVGEAADDKNRSVEDQLDKKSDEALHFFENNLFILSIENCFLRNSYQIFEKMMVKI